MAEEKVKKEEARNQTLLPVTARTIEKYLADISNYPILSRKEEYELAMKYKKTGDLLAARKLVLSNLRFVVRVANEYKNYGLNVLDLIQEGNIGLMKAVTKFDPTKGYRLISYAVWWIRAYIQDFIIKNWSLVKMGTTEAQRKLFYKLRSTKRKLGISGETLGREDSIALAEKLRVSTKAVEEMEKRMKAKDVSLDVAVGEKGEATHLDFLTDATIDHEKMLSKIQEDIRLKEQLEKALECLDERELFIIKNRVLKEKAVTLDKLGKKFNISRERVRQIEKTALRKMREYLEDMSAAE